jgi:transposase-like protein
MGIENFREQRGLAIIALGSQIRRVDAQTYRVKSQSGNGWYLVLKEGSEWKCECPDYYYRKVKCKHIYAVELSLNLRERVTSQNLGFESLCSQPEACKFCGSTNLIKRGHRKNKSGRVQRFLCKDCGRRFVVNEAGFQKMEYNPKIVTLALDLYFKGVSLRKITDHIKQFYGLKVHFSTILRWIQKYVQVMKEYVNDFTPQVSDIWHVDETIVNVKGQCRWLWNLMDNDTRFILAMQLSKSREIPDARKVFAEAKDIAKVKPQIVVTDGLRAYEDAFNKEFFTLRKPRTKHLRLASIRDKVNNNPIERFHGTVRERGKVMRALKQDAPTNQIIEGFRIYYNFIRPHMALNGLTPAEVANIRLQLGQNKWEDLIRKSVKKEGLS